ncbi:MAG: transcription-repair coupling factor [Geminicoccaceae bacterium]
MSTAVLADAAGTAAAPVLVESQIVRAPEGPDGLYLGRFLRRQGGEHLHVATDAERASRLIALVRFVAPEIETILLPAWDCLPFDRVSPTVDVMAARLGALASMVEPAKGPRLVVATVNAVLQRVVPRVVVSADRLAVDAGGKLDRDAFLHHLERQGYRRCSTVVESGDYAVRGGLIDVFPNGDTHPVRIDLFGKDVESLRKFDPISQRSLAKISRFELRPVSEVVLNADSIERFKVGYLQRFGAVSADPLFDAIAAGHPFAGMEHWLPLFYPELDTVFDYVDADAGFSVDARIETALQARIDAITDYYDARQEAAEVKGPLAGTPYRALEPERLYLSDDLLRQAIRDRQGFRFELGEPFPGQPVLDDAGGRPGRSFLAERSSQETNLFDAVRGHLEERRGAGRKAIIAGASGGSSERLAKVLADHQVELQGPVEDLDQALAATRPVMASLPLEAGFETDELVVVTERDILGDRIIQSRKRARKNDKAITEIGALRENDLVVHLAHGIGRFEGLEAIEIGGAPHDCLKLIYAGNDKLFVPVENLDVLTRYGSEGTEGQLDRLGGVGWQARRARIKKRIREIADELLKIAAERQLRKGEPLERAHGLYDEFCARFPYDETEDQTNAIGDVLDDLASGKPMDRLICGDVGFGKTEVALRAAFVVALSGRQVAVLAPTTLLARQHYDLFRDRFRGFPVKLGMLSRFVSTKEAKQVKDGLARGSIDIVIGTHALLGKTVTFEHLGLVVIDEEQHFGVTHKERLKQLRAEVHVLTMTATPIPRTLQMALGGLKEMSIIATPPVDRLAVRTFVMPADPVVLREALLRERYRGGQSFYVCPRIEDQHALAHELRKLVPELKIAVANGQMPTKALEDVMQAFYDGAVDVLLATNIIESGLDIPTANTMIVHKSHLFGLSQLYQLRGRIGRGKVRGYAYFTVPPRQKLHEIAERRLQVMQTIDGLGAGFQLASHDMDIRGHGNLLGDEQSGHVREVGFELYNQMLEEAVQEARDRAEERDVEAHEDKWAPQITVDAAAMMPESYVQDLDLRLSLYRQLSQLSEEDEVEAFAAELIDRFGPIPDETEHLLRLVRIKIACRRAHVEKVDTGPKGIVVGFRNNSFPHPERLIRAISESRGKMKVRGDHRLVVFESTNSPDERLTKTRELVERLAQLAA